MAQGDVGIYASQISGHLWAPNGAMDALATVTVPSGGLASIEFAGIPQGYKHLEIRGLVRSTRTGSGYDWFTSRFNSNSGSSYSFHILMGQGAAPYVYGTGSQTSFYVGALSQASVASGTYGAFIMNVADYASASKCKTVRTTYGHEISANNTESNVGTISGGFYSISPVTSVSFIIPAGGNFAEGSTVSLYGVK
jgi:hypothetical protein